MEHAEGRIGLDEKIWYPPHSAFFGAMTAASLAPFVLGQSWVCPSSPAPPSLGLSRCWDY